MKIERKMVSLVVAVSLIMGCLIGGTLAWLTDETDSVTNTFTVGNVAIALTETPNTDSDNNGVNDCWKAQMIPGTRYSKDPKVSVTSDTNADCYLFVKFEEKDNPSDYLTYESTLTSANGWTQGDGTNIPSDVWYRTVAKDADLKEWNLLKENCVTVKTSVTEDTMTEASKAKLIYTAYAVQKDNLTVEQAWDELN